MEKPCDAMRALVLIVNSKNSWPTNRLIISINVRIWIKQIDSHLNRVVFLRLNGKEFKYRPIDKKGEGLEEEKQS